VLRAGDCGSKETLTEGSAAREGETLSSQQERKATEKGKKGVKGKESDDLPQGKARRMFPRLQLTYGMLAAEDFLLDIRGRGG